MLHSDSGVGVAFKSLHLSLTFELHKTKKISVGSREISPVLATHNRAHCKTTTTKLSLEKLISRYENEIILDEKKRKKQIVSGSP